MPKQRGLKNERENEKTDIGGFICSADGGDPKDYINSQLRNAPMDYGTGGTTDIGTALLVAEETLEALQKKNGLESIVFLFTDGVTELNYTNTYEKSIQNMHKAEQKMCENNIKLCGVFLNKDKRNQLVETDAAISLKSYCGYC